MDEKINHHKTKFIHNRKLTNAKSTVIIVLLQIICYKYSHMAQERGLILELFGEFKNKERKGRCLERL